MADHRRNLALRGVVGLRQEDVLETLLGNPKLARAEATIGQSDWTALVQQLVQILGPVFAALIMQKFTPKKEEPKPAPAPAPPPVPGAPPVSAPAAETGHRIVGGRAKLTGITEGGPLGPRVDAARLAEIKAGTANAPHDSRFEFDFTPTFEDGHEGGPDDPYFLTTPLAPKAAGDTDGPMQQVRLRYEYDGPGSADLSREYANYGCTPRIRVKTGGGAGGVLSDLRFEFAGGAVAVEGVDEIHVGRGA